MNANKDFFDSVFFFFSIFRKNTLTEWTQSSWMNRKQELNKMSSCNIFFFSPPILVLYRCFLRFQHKTKYGQSSLAWLPERKWEIKTSDHISVFACVTVNWQRPKFHLRHRCHCSFSFASAQHSFYGSDISRLMLFFDSMSIDLTRPHAIHLSTVTYTPSFRQRFSVCLSTFVMISPENCAIQNYFHSFWVWEI